MTNWEAIAGIITLSVLIEAIVEFFLPTFPQQYKWTKTYIAALLAVVVAVAYNADLPAALGLPAVRYVGPILTGLIIGRGANFIAILVKRGQVVTAPAQSVDSVPQADDTAERQISSRIYNAGGQ